VIPSPGPLSYRGKAEFHLAGGRGKPGRAGLMALASNDLVECDQCLIVDESINRKYQSLRDLLRQNAVRSPGERLVIWSDELGESPTAVSTGSRGLPDVTRIVNGKRLSVPYRGFFQANVFLVGELVARVVEMSALAGRETLIDAYGGAGLFSLFLGPDSGRFFGIEGDPEAVRCAGINLSRHGLTHGSFIAGDAAEILEREFIRRREKADVIVLDPPRDGCGERALAAVAALRPESIVYVSCNPATQARDCRRLFGYGYSLRRLQPLDMFPQTAHIEVVALLEKAQASPRAWLSSSS
jgi:tRNA/tmRNA/rRNA uracil-C5-methylase (TrmA/RlmC/RlmD family)